MDDGSQFLFSVLEERTVQFAEAQRQFQQLEERTVQFEEAQRQFQQLEVDTVERMADLGCLVGPLLEEFDKMKDQMKVMREELDQMKDQMKNMEAPRAQPATTTTGLAEAARARAASHFTRSGAESVLEEMHRKWSEHDWSEFVPRRRSQIPGIRPMSFAPQIPHIWVIPQTYQSFGNGTEQAIFFNASM